MKSRLRTVALVATATLLVFVPSGPLWAEGSANFYPSTATECGPSGECRAAIEWRTGVYGPSAPGEVVIRRRTLFTVYANAGEQILLGSSALGDLSTPGTNSADIVAWAPSVISDPDAAALPAPTYSCVEQRNATGDASQGVLDTRSKELVGAKSIDGSTNPSGYTPCYFTATQSGLYNVGFYGTAGGSSNTQVPPNGRIDPAGGLFPNPAASTAVYAWDISVRPENVTSGPDSTFRGRTFTRVVSATTGGNPRPVSMSFYMTSFDGFRYRVDAGSMDPNAFVFYGNRSGFTDADGTPLNHDVVGFGGDASNLSVLLGGTKLVPAEYPLSFEPLAPETLAVLGIPTTPVNPVLNSVTYSGRSTATASRVGQGGEFTLSSGTAGNYEIVVSRDGTNFDPGLPANAVVRGVLDAPGISTVSWDGKDNNGDPFPAGNYPVRANLRGGEYHAPMIDVESSINGGPRIVLENPPGGICPFSNEVSNGSNCTRAFFDDRGYTTSTGVDVGTPGGLLCPSFAGTVPNPLFSDPETGFDSSSNRRAFGDLSGSNANTYCPPSGGTLGDAKGLDIWTYIPSPVRSAALEVLPLPQAPAATNDSNSTSVGVPVTVSNPNAGLLSNDTGSGLRVTATTNPTHGSITVSPDGTYTYTPTAGFSGTDSVDYTITDDAGQTATATLTITVTPAAADNGYATNAGTPVAIPVTDLLSNDTGVSLTVSATTPPANGQVVSGPRGDLTYTPNAGFTGTDTFTYTVTGEGGQATATVTVLVSPVAITNQTAGGTPVTGDVIPSGGSGLTVTGNTTPANGTVAINSDGSYTYTPREGFSGEDSFNYTVTDTTGSSTTGTVRIVLGAPAATPASATTTTTAAPATSGSRLPATGAGGLPIIALMGLALLVMGAAMPKRRR